MDDNWCLRPPPLLNAVLFQFHLDDLVHSSLKPSVSDKIVYIIVFKQVSFICKCIAESVLDELSLLCSALYLWSGCLAIPVYGSEHSAMNWATFTTMLNLCLVHPEDNITNLCLRVLMGLKCAGMSCSENILLWVSLTLPSKMRQQCYSACCSYPCTCVAVCLVGVFVGFLKAQLGSPQVFSSPLMCVCRPPFLFCIWWNIFHPLS